MILDILTSGGLGAIVGLIGSWLTKQEERKILKVRNEHEKEMGELALKEIAAESKRDVILAHNKIDLAEAEAFTQSQAPSSQLGESIKGVFRPIITIYLLGITTWLTSNVWILVSGLEALTSGELIGILKQIVSQVIFLTVMSVSWWFGARPSHPSRAAR